MMKSIWKKYENCEMTGALMEWILTEILEEVENTLKALEPATEEGKRGIEEALSQIRRLYEPSVSSAQTQWELRKRIREAEKGLLTVRPSVSEEEKQRIDETIAAFYN